MLVVPLYGGLGNQLFGVAFAAWAQINEISTIRCLVTRNSRNNKTHGQNALHAFVNETGLSWSSESLIDSLVIRSVRFLNRNFHSQLNYRGLRLIPDLTELVREPETEQRLLITNSFQSNRYLGELQSIGSMLELQPRFQSEKYKKLREMVTNEENVFAVHVRRGDYLKSSVSQALPIQFYLNALASLGFDHRSRVLIFSDDPELVRQELKSTGLAESASIFYVDRSLSAAESLSLASSCQNLVMSKSTFSWWAAKTGNKQKRVAYPRNWDYHLIEQSWIPISVDSHS